MSRICDQGPHHDRGTQVRLHASHDVAGTRLGDGVLTAVLRWDAVAVHCPAVVLGLQVLQVECEVQDVDVGDLQCRELTLHAIAWGLCGDDTRSAGSHY